MTRQQNLGSLVCRLPSETERPLITTGCITEGGKTFCVNDRVRRSNIKGPGIGTVIALQQGADNRGRKKQAARVCWDGSEARELAYPFLFVELKKAK